MNIGTYTFSNIPVNHPLGFFINDTDKLQVTSGTNVETKNIDGINVSHYTGDITVEVKDNFGIISYHCSYHGYMGGQNRLVFI